MPFAYSRLGSGYGPPTAYQVRGAPYHVTSSGDGEEAIYLHHIDREAFDAVLSKVCERYCAFLAARNGQRSPWADLKHQIHMA